MAQDAEKLEAQAARLRELKKLSRRTFKEIADAVEVTERQVQRWFAGDGDIGPQNLKKLAEYLGTTQDYIEYGSERTTRGPTPDLLGAGNQQLDRIEEKVDRLLNAFGLTTVEQADLLGQALLEAARALGRGQSTSPTKNPGPGRRRRVAGDDAG